MLALTGDECHAYQEAINILAGTGKTLIQAVHEYADVIRALNGVPLPIAIEGYKRAFDRMQKRTVILHEPLQLRITLVGEGTIQLAWSTNSAAFTLRQANAVPSANWTVVTNRVDQYGANCGRVWTQANRSSTFNFGRTDVFL